MSRGYETRDGFAKIVGPFNLKDPEQMQSLKTSIAAMLKCKTACKVWPEANSKTHFSLWREKKGMTDASRVYRGLSRTEPSSSFAGPKLSELRRDKRKQK